MQQVDRRDIVIVGGGTAGWMTAAAFGHFLSPENFNVILIESDSIGTVGVGEATIPHIRQFNSMLGIDENEFMRETNATYKLGIQFNDWGYIGASYIHPFGLSGHDINGVDFHHYWLRLQSEGRARPFDDYSFSAQAALAGKFDYPNRVVHKSQAEYGYAFHLDATRYAQYLRKYATERNVTRLEGKVIRVEQSSDSEKIAALYLDDGQRITGELFVDCSGFRSLLIGEFLGVPYETWDQWLPCDRAVAVACARSSAPNPYTQAFAHGAGWRWRIPLTSRTGNGSVYCSRYLSDDEAATRLLDALDGEALAEPRVIRFQTGKRKMCWQENCIAIGLASGFLEPLESTSIYLVQIAIQRLLEYFPGRNTIGVERDLFNEQLNQEYDRVRDFLILHYWANRRDDSQFWLDCAATELPDSLKQKITLFRESAHVEQYRYGLFMPASWLAVYLGQSFLPERFDSRVSVPAIDDIDRYFQDIYHQHKEAVSQLSRHDQALARVFHSEANYPAAQMSLYGGAP